MPNQTYKKTEVKSFGRYAVTPTSSLQLFAHNSRTHSEEQIQELINSIKEFGFTNPILIDESNVLIAGHARLEAAKKLGLSSIPSIILEGLTSAQKAALVIADNKLALKAGWDEEILRAQLTFLRESDFDISLTGFSESEVADLFPVSEETFADEDDCPEAEETEPICKLGDIWQLGEHRLMCGDSMDIGQVEKLIDNNQIDMVYTDPPYGIKEKTHRKETGKTFKNKSVAPRGDFREIIGDDSIDTAVKVFEIAEKLSKITCYWGGNYYSCSFPPSPCWIVWDKRVEDNQRDINSDCELAYVKHPSKKSVRIFRHLWKGMIKATEKAEKRIHPTQKPIALAEWCFEELAPKSHTILDLFGGSGSTLIACEKTNRKCFMMELDPKYCDVIIQRWQNYTGKKAQKVN